MLTVWSLALVILLTFACGTEHAVLDVAAPPTATAGSPFTVTVDVIIGQRRDTVINSRIHFTSSDPGAVLPADYYFTRSDAGSHTWPNGVTLMTPGKQTITATIIMATGITGTANVTVSSATSSARLQGNAPPRI